MQCFLFSSNLKEKKRDSQIKTTASRTTEQYWGIFTITLICPRSLKTRQQPKNHTSTKGSERLVYFYNYHLLLLSVFFILLLQLSKLALLVCLPLVAQWAQTSAPTHVYFNMMQVCRVTPLTPSSYSLKAVWGHKLTKKQTNKKPAKHWFCGTTSLLWCCRVGWEVVISYYLCCILCFTGSETCNKFGAEL